MIGNRLRVMVDGLPTVDVPNVVEAFPGFEWPSSGLIGLQDSHATGAGFIEYRNIKVVPLVR